MTPTTCTLETLRTATEAELLEGVAHSDSVTTWAREEMNHLSDIQCNLRETCCTETLIWLQRQMEDKERSVDAWQSMGLKCENELNTRNAENDAKEANRQHTLMEAARLLHEQGQHDVACRVEACRMGTALPDQYDPFKDE